MRHFWTVNALLTVLVLASLAAPALLRADITITTNVYTNADARVYVGAPDVNDGTGTLYVNPVGIRSYLNFDVTSAVPAGGTFHSATLWVYAYAQYNVPWATIGAHEVTGTWTETGITWNNQPTYNAVPLDTKYEYSWPLWWSWDVSKAWPGTGDFDIVLAPIGSGIGQTGFRSRESGPSAYLEVTYGVPEPGALGMLAAFAIPGLMLWRKRRKAA